MKENRVKKNVNNNNILSRMKTKERTIKKREQYVTNSFLSPCSSEKMKKISQLLCKKGVLVEDEERTWADFNSLVRLSINWVWLSRCLEIEEIGSEDDKSICDDGGSMRFNFCMIRLHLCRRELDFHLVRHASNPNVRVPVRVRSQDSGSARVRVWHRTVRVRDRTVRVRDRTVRFRFKL
jgi:hypothetical protein